MDNNILNLGNNSVSNIVLDAYQKVDLQNPEFVTPDSLLAYCQSRLRDLDARIQEKFQAENNAIKEQKNLSTLKSYIQSTYPNGIPADKLDEVQHQIELALGSTKSPDARNALETMNTAITNMIGKRDAGQTQQDKDACKYSQDEMKATFLTPLEDAAKGIGQGRELSMIDLQSVVSQRQTALQLTTNLMNAISEAAKSIAANTGK